MLGKLATMTEEENSLLTRLATVAMMGKTDPNYYMSEGYNNDLNTLRGDFVEYFKKHKTGLKEESISAIRLVDIEELNLLMQYILNENDIWLVQFESTLLDKYNINL